MRDYFFEKRFQRQGRSGNYFGTLARHSLPMRLWPCYNGAMRAAWARRTYEFRSHIDCPKPQGRLPCTKFHSVFK
jgi:hypothetical protein